MTGSDNSQNSGQGGNPAWDEFFNAIPEDYREDVQPLVTPVLEKWDRNVQQRFDSYKPYEKYIEDKVDPQVMDYAMNLLDTLNDNDGALQVFNQLGQYLEQQGLIGQEEDTGKKAEEEEEVNWDDIPPALKKQIEQLQNGFSTLAEAQLAEARTKKEADEDAALEAELKSLKQKYGDYDEDWVLAKMINGMDAEDAVKSYTDWLDNTLKERNRPQPGFKALGSGGDFPSGNAEFNPKKASAREVQDMIAQRLMDFQRDR